MNFKRDNELVAKVNAIAENVSAEDAKTIKELVRKYESTTYKEWNDRHEFHCSMVSDMTNDCGFADDKIAEHMASDHPTIQQSFFRFVVKFIKKMADKTYWDGRNEASVSTCKKIAELLGDNTYLPFV